MKCPECSHNQSYSDGMNCKNCHYVFVFDPKKDKIADGKFIAAINKTSANDTYYFTRNQLYAQLVRKTADTTIPLWVVIGICAALILVGLLVGFPVEIIGILGFVAAICLLIAMLNKPIIADQSTAEEFIDRYQRLGKPERLAKLIEKPSLHEPPPEWQEPDIYDYGFERLLIVDDDLLVDLFVKNNFHANERALILSENFYPNYLLPMARRTLEENPQLPVFFLHSSSAEGRRLQERVIASGALPLEGHPLIDLGFKPEDVKKMKNLKGFSLKQNDYAIPVDLLMFTTLTAGIGVALAEQVALGSLLNQPASSEGATANFG